MILIVSNQTELRYTWHQRLHRMQFPVYSCSIHSAQSLIREQFPTRLLLLPDYTESAAQRAFLQTATEEFASPALCLTARVGALKYPLPPRTTLLRDDVPSATAKKTILRLLQTEHGLDLRSLSAGPLRLDALHADLCYGGVPIDASCTALRMLTVLLAFQPRPIERQHLLMLCFRPRLLPHADNVATQFSYLNTAAKAAVGRPIVKHAYKQGYVLVRDTSLATLPPETQTTNSFEEHFYAI